MHAYTRKPQHGNMQIHKDALFGRNASLCGGSSKTALYSIVMQCSAVGWCINCILCIKKSLTSINMHHHTAGITKIHLYASERSTGLPETAYKFAVFVFFCCFMWLLSQLLEYKVV